MYYLNIADKMCYTCMHVLTRFYVPRNNVYMILLDVNNFLMSKLF